MTDDSLELTAEEARTVDRFGIFDEAPAQMPDTPSSTDKLQLASTLNIGGVRWRIDEYLRHPYDPNRDWFHLVSLNRNSVCHWRTTRETLERQTGREL